MVETTKEKQKTKTIESILNSLENKKMSPIVTEGQSIKFSPRVYQ